MIAALSTLSVLVLLWVIVAVSAEMLDESGGKVLAALRGRSQLAMAPVVRPINWKVSARARTTRPMRARPTLRAAA